MKITKLDKNMKMQSALLEKDIRWFDGNDKCFVKYGVAGEDGKYSRMPKESAGKVSMGVEYLSENTSGVRLRICTSSPYIAIKAVYSDVCRISNMPLSGTCGFDLYSECNGRQFFLGAYIRRRI